MATERIPLTQPIESRNGTFAKDSYSANCVFETRDQKREFVKRPGLTFAAQVLPITPPASTPSQGLASFNDKLVSVINNTVYQTSPSTYATTTVGTTSASTSQSYFVKTFLDAYLFLHNKINGYLYKKSDSSFGAITNDKVVSISIDNEGVNYSTGITLTFSAGTVAATPTVTGGYITSVLVTNAGSGLGSAPTCTIVKPATVTPTATGTTGFFTIVVSSATGIYTGMGVTGTGIAPNAKVTNVASTTVTLDTINTGAVSGTITFADNGSSGVLTPNLCSFPTGPYVSGAVFLDNYVFIGTSLNRIYNSNLGDPTSWSALNYLTFEQTTDTLVGIVKHLNYLVAMGKTSLQLFYDNANAVGSPLSVAQSYTSEVGCANGDSIVASNNTVLWVGTTKTHGRSVYLMDGVSPVKISTDNIDRHLEADDMSKVTAYCYKFNGHTLYVLTLHNTNQTLVFDLDEKMWYQWTQYAMASNDQPNPGTYVESYFRPSFYAEVLSVPYVLDDDTAALYYFNVNAYQDNGQPIYCRTVTDIMDNGTTKRKFYGRLEIIGDKVAGTMQIRHSGDDYNSWSSYRSVDLNASRSQVYLSGSDRRRAWEFLCTSNVPLRLDAAEIDFRIGEMDQEQQVGGGRYRR
jgi:hypothetical protein